MSAMLWKEHFHLGEADPAALASFMRLYIEPNIHYTCLPHPYFPQIDSFLEKRGLRDLHIHLNGSTETDMAWQTYLQFPRSIYLEFNRVFDKEKVREQVEQEEHGFRPIDMYHRLCAARRIRRALIYRIFDGRYSWDLEDILDQTNTANFLHNRSFAIWQILQEAMHPMVKVFQSLPASHHHWSDVCLESMMLILVMDHLFRTRNQQLASAFHYYLLLLGFANRFLVQQVSQNGFDQFQKLTLNGLREVNERTFKNRFLQCHGNNLRNLAIMEGRFSPKDSPQKNMDLISKILGGWDDFIRQCRFERGHQPKLRLVAHFIKQPDGNRWSRLANDSTPSLRIRHRTLRIDTWIKSQALVAIQEYPRIKGLLVGADAAANELDASPEVFAPSFRLLRRAGIQHFTYHVGEDFHHLLGGLRAIYEAVYFLDLRRGDRVGHGTAAGIDPALWLDRAGSSLVLSQGEWLDDLIFTHHLIENHPQAQLNEILPELRCRIEDLAETIYGKYFSLHALNEAWRHRRHCPIHLLTDFESVSNHIVWSREEWAACASVNQDEDSYTLLKLYHTNQVQQRYNAMMELSLTAGYSDRLEVPMVELLTAQRLKALQDIILQDLHRKEIILETLPTSNVRISFYRNFGEHHLWRWLGLHHQNGRAFLPPVVVGTDDTGIFATNIRNEYSHIYDQLTNSQGLSQGEAMEILTRLDRDSGVYAFDFVDRNDFRRPSQWRPS
jgi:adenosine deaminase